MNNTHKEFVAKVVLYILPPILPLSAALIILLQQIYYPAADVAVVFNIMLLLMSLIEFLPLAINRQDKQPCLLVCNIALLFGGFLYNVFLGGIPSPLENFSEFFNSICGVWVVVSALEVGFYLFPFVVRLYHERKEMYEDDKETDQSGGNARSNVSTRQNGKATLPDDPYQRSDKQNRQRKKSRKGSDGDYFSGIAFLSVVVLMLGALAFPLLRYQKSTQWYVSVREFAEVVYGTNLINKSDLLVFVLYIVMMIAIVAIVFFTFAILYYVVKGIIRDSHGGIKAILQKYSAPVIILGIVFVGIRSLGKTGEGGISVGFEMLGMLLESMLLAIIGIIGVFVLVEVVGLMLDECIAQASLLKTAMHLVFVLVVQYTTNFITGILKVFAIKDVIESILLFFMPDLNVTIGSRVDYVFNKALEMEICKIEKKLLEGDNKAGKEKLDGLQPGMRMTTSIRRSENDEK